MKKRPLSLTLSILFVSALSFPALDYLFHILPKKNLYGYVEPSDAKPEKKLSDFFEKKWQPYLENAFEKKSNFKIYLIRTFNELNFRLFSEAPRINLYMTKQYGLYSKMSIDSLNDEFINRKKLNKNYAELAKKIKTIQTLLEKKGKHLEVVISTSKPYIHTEGLEKRFLLASRNNIYSKVASLGRQLKKHGVNVIDSGPFLRKYYQETGIEMHPYSGVHWNYYAGCLIAREMLADIQKGPINIPQLSCGKPNYISPIMVDLDGLLLLNVLTKVNLKKPAPFPTPTSTSTTTYKPKILLVGDSFMGQIIFSLDAIHAYSRLILSNYFQTRDLHNYTYEGKKDDYSSVQDIQRAVIRDAIDSDVIVLQMVDYNTTRYGYGFVDALLEQLCKQPIT